MLAELFFLALFANDIAYAAQYSAPLQFTEEPTDVQFSSQTSGYLHCVAQATSSYASSSQIAITWRFGNGSLVRNVSDIIQALPNGTLWFKPFERLQPAIHHTTYQCVANLTLHNQAILSRQAFVRGVIVKPFKVTVEDQYVSEGETATFSCLYPQEVSSYVQIKTWFVDKEKKPNQKRNFVIHDVKGADYNKLYYCIVINIFTNEILASNVAKLYEIPGSQNVTFKFNIAPVNKTVLRGGTVLFECLVSRTRNVEYTWKHNDVDIKLDPRYSLVHGHSMRIMDTSIDDKGKYTCTAAHDKAAKRKVINSTVYLLVQVPLAFRARPSKICTPYYGNATFPCEVTGYPPPHITWYKNGRKIIYNSKAVKEGNSLIITSAWGKDEGIYQCIASNGRETIHQAASLIVGAQAPRILESFNAKNLSLYDKLDISCKATGKPQATLFWYRDGFPVNEASDHRIHLKHYHDLWTLQIRNITAADSGIYRCEAMNRAGSNFSEAKILVKGPAKVTFLPKKVSGLLGKDVSITCKANGFPLAQITWYDKDDNLAPRGFRQKVTARDGEKTLTIKGLTVSDSGLYKCKASSNVGPPDSASVNLTVHRKLDPVYVIKAVDEGTKQTFYCHGNCDRWTKDGKVVTNSPRATVHRVPGICLLTIISVLGSDTGNYTCHTQTGAGVHQSTTELLVITRPYFINPRRPKKIDVLEHENVRMTCHGDGFPSPRIIWRYKVGGSFVDIPNSPRFKVTRNGSLTILSASAKDETDYSCELQNSHSRGDDLTITLHVNVPARIVNWMNSTFRDAGTVSNLHCAASGDESLNITWSKNGEAITENPNVKIQRNTKSSRQSTLTILATARKDRGNYTCKVVNPFGKDEKQMKLEIRDRPDPPKLLEDNDEKTKKSIRIYWKPGFHWNSPIKSYQINFRTSARPFRTAQWANISGRDTSYKITGLKSYTRYDVRVRAENALGWSELSSVFHVETAEDVPSAAPTIINITPEEPSPNYKQSLRIEWKPLSVENRNGVIQGYVIWYKINSSEFSFTKKTVKPIDGTQAMISNLKPYTYYEIKIQASTDAGDGPNSTASVKRTSEGVPSKPPNSIAHTQTSTSIFLSWSAPPQNSFNGELIGYLVSYHHHTSKPFQEFTARDQTNITLKGLRKYTNYTITISARTSLGAGKSSNPILVRTQEDVPGPPKDLIAVTTSVRSIKLRWSSPDEPNGKITNYKIYFVKNIEDIDDAYNIRIVDGDVHTHEIESLIENRTYYFWICATTSKGEGNRTNYVEASTSKGPPSFINSHSGYVTARWKTTATLICRFSGFPIPTITWLDSKERPLDLNNAAKYQVNIRDLEIHDLQREDSGRYVCKVTNKWGTIKKGIILKVQAPPDPPKNVGFIGVNSTAVKVTWINGFNGNSVITRFVLMYQRRIDTKWTIIRLPGDSTEFVVNNVESGRSYSFKLKASNEIGQGNFSKTKFMRFNRGLILRPIEEQEILEDEVEASSSDKTIFKDSAVLGTLIGVSLLIIFVILILALLTKLGYNPGSKVVQRSVETWRWLVAKGISAKDRRNMNRRSGGSSTDGHLGGSSSSLSQPASNNGSTFSLPRSSSRVTESAGYPGSVYPPPPFGNFTPGPNGGVRASGSSDEGIGPETRSEVNTRPGTGDKEYRSLIPLRSSNGTPAPATLMMCSREYIDPEGVGIETISLKMEDKMEDMKANESEDNSADVPGGKQRVYVQSLGHCAEIFSVPANISPGRPKYEDGHFIIGPDIDRILAYRPPRCYDSTSSEYSSSRDELAQAYEFGKLHHLDDFYGRPTLESASSSGETAGSEKDGICHFTSELTIGRPFFIPVAILPPPPNQRLRTRDRKRNPQGVPLNTYYEKDETLV